MLNGAKVAVFTDIYTKHINMLCGHNVESLDVKHGGTQTNSGQYRTKKTEEKVALAVHSLHPPPSPLTVHFLSNPTVQSLIITGYCHITRSLKTPTLTKFSCHDNDGLG